MPFVESVSVRKYLAEEWLRDPELNPEAPQICGGKKSIDALNFTGLIHKAGY